MIYTMNIFVVLFYNFKIRRDFIIDLVDVTSDNAAEEIYPMICKVTVQVSVLPSSVMTGHNGLHLW